MTVAYPFNDTGSLDLHEAYLEALETPGMLRIQMPHGEPAWLATRYADARFVLGDRRFSRAMAAERDEPRMRAGRNAGGFLSMDPPDHTRLRTLVAKAFTVRRIEELRPRVRDLATHLVEDMVAVGPPVDLVDAFALALPVQVICELLGVPASDRSRFRVWSNNVMSTSRLTTEEFNTSQDEMHAYIRGLVADHRAVPRDDLMTALIEAHDEGDRLSEVELVNMCSAILVAGHETTASQIPNFLVTLLDHPRAMDKLRSDPTLIPGAVEELLRFIPLGAGAAFSRYATEDVKVGDVLVREGEPVIVAIGAANRDGLRFEEPNTLRVEAPPEQHLALGHGIHHCLGAALARMELQEALRVLLAELPGLHLAGEIVWKTEMLVRGPVTMPVGW
ncbi:cytochrome P450 [Actinophytocola oryzae]|uniref:Cytochrome P450 n=1 Tax=Actinophytocola oryzae TaxID=502181 RepID=A0A4R7VR08_9PSEU|nr:cytochrome P450 [Actinophytocola oryzae]TDV52124.1 cytochrome P450 [Actinophytocola oryzae]